MFIKLAYDSSSTQFNLPATFQEDLEAFSNQYIPEEDLYIDEENKGREDEFHITLLYGINPSEDEACLKGIKETFKEELSKPVKATLGKISKFNKEDYDVVKLDITDCPLLHLMSEYIRENFKNNNKYPDYHPHCTLAYVQKGTCEKLVGDSTFEGKEVILDKFKYSPSKGEKEFINLKKTAGKVLLTLGQLEEVKQFLMDKLYTLQNRNEIRNIYNYEELTSWLYKNARMKIAKIGPAQQEMQNYSGELMDTPQHQALQESEPGKTNVTTEKELTMFPKKKKGNKQYEIILPNHTKALQALNLLKSLQQHKYDFQVENTQFIFTDEEEFKDVQQLFKNNNIMSLSKTSQSYLQNKPHFIKISNENLSECLDYLGFGDERDFYDRTGQQVRTIMGDWIDITDKLGWGVTGATVYSDIAPYDMVFTKEGLFFPMSDYLYSYHNITKTGLNNLKFAIDDRMFQNKGGDKKTAYELEQEGYVYDRDMEIWVKEEPEEEEDEDPLTAAKDELSRLVRWKNNSNGNAGADNKIESLRERIKQLEDEGKDHLKANSKKKTAISTDIKAKYEELTSKVNKLFQNASAKGWDKDSLAEYNALKAEIDELYTNTLDKKSNHVETEYGDWYDYKNISKNEFLNYFLSLGYQVTGSNGIDIKFASDPLYGSTWLTASNPQNNDNAQLDLTTMEVESDFPLDFLENKLDKKSMKKQSNYTTLDEIKNRDSEIGDPEEVRTLHINELQKLIQNSEYFDLKDFELENINEALRQVTSMKKQANYTTLDEIKNRDSEIGDPEEVRTLHINELQKLIQNSEYFDLKDFELENINEALRQVTSMKKQANYSERLDEIEEELKMLNWDLLTEEGEANPNNTHINKYKMDIKELKREKQQLLDEKESYEKYSMKKQASIKSELSTIFSEDPKVYCNIMNKAGFDVVIGPQDLLYIRDNYRQNYEEISTDSLWEKMTDKQIELIQEDINKFGMPKEFLSSKKNMKKQTLASLDNIFEILPGLTKSAYEKGQDILNKEMPQYVLSRKNKYNDDIFVKGASFDLPSLIKKAKYNKDLFISKVAADIQVPKGLASEEFKQDLKQDIQKVVEDDKPIVIPDKKGGYGHLDILKDSKTLPVGKIIEKLMARYEGLDEDEAREIVDKALMSNPELKKKSGLKEGDNVYFNFEGKKIPVVIEEVIEDEDKYFITDKKEIFEYVHSNSLSPMEKEHVIEKNSIRKFAALGEEETPEVDPELASALPFDTGINPTEEVINPPIEIENLFEPVAQKPVPQINPEQSGDNIINQVLNCVNDCYPYDLVPASVWAVAQGSGIASMSKDKLIPILNGVAFKLGLPNVEWDEFLPEENNLNIEGNQINLGGVEAQPTVNDSQTIQEIFNTNNYDNKAPSLFSIDRIVDERMKLFVNLEALLRESADVISSSMNNVQKAASVLHYKLSDVKSKSTNRRGQITEGNINYMIHLSSTLDRRLEKQIEVSIPIRGSKVVNPTHFKYAMKEYPLQSWYLNSVMES